MGYGHCIQATLPHARRGKPGLLLMDSIVPRGRLLAGLLATFTSS